MAYALIANTGSNTATTTGAINTTGANLIVVGIAVDSGTMANPTDSKSNSYTALTGSVVGGDNEMKLFYVYNPTVGSGHTFTQPADYGCICVAAFSGAVATPFDQQNGNTTASGTSLSTGSVTPTETSELIVTGLLAGNTNSNHAINGSFTITNNFNGTDGARYGGAMAYLIQTSIAAANPSWSWTGTIEAAARIATFKDTPISTAVKDIIGQGFIPFAR